MSVVKWRKNILLMVFIFAIVIFGVIFLYMMNVSNNQLYSIDSWNAYCVVYDNYVLRYALLFYLQ